MGSHAKAGRYMVSAGMSCHYLVYTGIGIWPNVEALLLPSQPRGTGK